MSRKSHVRSAAKTAAAEMEDDFESASRFWGRLRLRFPKAVREVVDIAAELGGLTLHDIELLQVAQFQRLEERIKKLERKPQTSTAVSKLESLKLQCLKHLRTIRVVSNPITTPNEGRHPEPEEMELRRRAKADLAARMQDVGAPKVDTGVELN